MFSPETQSSGGCGRCCRWREWKELLTMQFTKVSVFVVLLAILTSEVGGYTTDPYNDVSNANGDSSLCRVIRDSRKTVLTSFRNQFTVSSSSCDISDHCANVTCIADFSRGRVNAGLVLNLCEEEPELTYWVDLPGQWDEPWNHTFSSKNFNGQVERIEITGSSKETKPTRWFIKTTFSISHGRNRINQSIKYISSLSVLQICQSQSASSPSPLSEDTCTNTTLLNFPRLPQSQICELPVLHQSDIAEDDGYRHKLALLQMKPSGGQQGAADPSSTRSSRNANADAWDPELLHRQAAEGIRKFENGESLKPTPGDPCNIQDIFGCGQGSTCVLSPDGSGTCECLTGYAFDALSGDCVKRAPSPLSPSDDPSSDESRSYSSAIGAVIAIIILVAIAAGIYFGTKYNYFSRIRHRIPVLRCWPFRRSQPWEDNVTMVNPLGPPDDDDPLLL